MSYRLDDIPVLYSVGTKLAYQINENYYGGTHYVWCAEAFDSPLQAPTSNPLTILNRYAHVCLKQDRHCCEISDNLAGIQRGAKAKFDAGVIDKVQQREIRKLINASKWDAFLPVLYIIPTYLVKAKCIEVPVKDRASNNSYEYKIEELNHGEFQAIPIEDIFQSLVSIPNGIVPSEARRKRRGS